MGAVLFEMVTGQLPFDGDTPIAIALAHIHKTPPAPSSLVSGLPDRVEGIILRAMMKSPTDRYRSAGEMRGDLLGETDLWRGKHPHPVLFETPAHQCLSEPAPAGEEARPPPA